MISIICPFYNHYDLVQKRLAEFFVYLPPCEVLLINDASTDVDAGQEGNISWWQTQLATKNIKLRYHKNDENLGFVGAMNLGGKNAKGDIFILFSDDVIVTGNFVTEIVTILEEDSRSLVGGRIIDFDSGWNTVNGKVVPYCEGWLVACTKDVWEELGGFDPIYAPSDYEDVDLSTTAKSLGIKLVALKNNYLHHMVAQSYGYNPEREARTKVNREKWIKKWEGRLKAV